jgi:hypothetical protein
LYDLFGVRIEAEDVETVGGLLAQRLGRVPIAGSTTTVAGLRLTAESLAGRRNRISTVTVERIGPAEPAAARPSREARPVGRGPASPDGEPGAGAIPGRDGAGQDGAAEQRQASNGLARSEAPPE